MASPSTPDEVDMQAETKRRLEDNENLCGALKEDVMLLVKHAEDVRARVTILRKDKPRRDTEADSGIIEIKVRLITVERSLQGLVKQIDQKENSISIERENMQNGLAMAESDRVSLDLNAFFAKLRKLREVLGVMDGQLRALEASGAVPVDAQAEQKSETSQIDSNKQNDSLLKEKKSLDEQTAALAIERKRLLEDSGNVCAALQEVILLLSKDTEAVRARFSALKKLGIQGKEEADGGMRSIEVRLKITERSLRTLITNVEEKKNAIALAQQKLENGVAISGIDRVNVDMNGFLTKVHNLRGVIGLLDAQLRASGVSDAAVSSEVQSVRLETKSDEQNGFLLLEKKRLLSNNENICAALKEVVVLLIEDTGALRKRFSAVREGNQGDAEQDGTMGEMDVRLGTTERSVQELLTQIEEKKKVIAVERDKVDADVTTSERDWGAQEISGFLADVHKLRGIIGLLDSQLRVAERKSGSAEPKDDEHTVVSDMRRPGDSVNVSETSTSFRSDAQTQTDSLQLERNGLLDSQVRKLREVIGFLDGELRAAGASDAMLNTSEIVGGALEVASRFQPKIGEQTTSLVAERKRLLEDSGSDWEALTPHDFRALSHGRFEAKTDKQTVSFVLDASDGILVDQTAEQKLASSEIERNQRTGEQTSSIVLDKNRLLEDGENVCGALKELIIPLMKDVEAVRARFLALKKTGVQGKAEPEGGMRAMEVRLTTAERSLRALIKNIEEKMNSFVVEQQKLKSGVATSGMVRVFLDLNGFFFKIHELRRVVGLIDTQLGASGVSDSVLAVVTSEDKPGLETKNNSQFASSQINSDQQAGSLLLERKQLLESNENVCAALKEVVLLSITDAGSVRKGIAALKKGIPRDAEQDGRINKMELRLRLTERSLQDLLTQVEEKKRIVAAQRQKLETGVSMLESDLVPLDLNGCFTQIRKLRGVIGLLDSQLRSSEASEVVVGGDERKSGSVQPKVDNQNVSLELERRRLLEDSVGVCAALKEVVMLLIKEAEAIRARSSELKKVVEGGNSNGAISETEARLEIVEQSLQALIINIEEKKSSIALERQNLKDAASERLPLDLSGCLARAHELGGEIRLLSAQLQASEISYATSAAGTSKEKSVQFEIKPEEQSLSADIKSDELIGSLLRKRKRLLGNYEHLCGALKEVIIMSINDTKGVRARFAAVETGIQEDSEQDGAVSELEVKLSSTEQSLQGLLTKLEEQARNLALEQDKEKTGVEIEESDEFSQDLNDCFAEVHKLREVISLLDAKLRTLEVPDSRRLVVVAEHEPGSSQPKVDEQSASLVLDRVRLLRDSANVCAALNEVIVLLVKDSEAVRAKFSALKKTDVQGDAESASGMKLMEVRLRLAERSLGALTTSIEEMKNSIALEQQKLENGVALSDIVPTSLDLNGLFTQFQKLRGMIGSLETQLRASGVSAEERSTGAERSSVNEENLEDSAHLEDVVREKVALEKAFNANYRQFLDEKENLTYCLTELTAAVENDAQNARSKLAGLGKNSIPIGIDDVEAKLKMVEVGIAQQRTENERALSQIKMARQRPRSMFVSALKPSAVKTKVEEINQWKSIVRSLNAQLSPAGISEVTSRQRMDYSKENVSLGQLSDLMKNINRENNENENHVTEMWKPQIEARRSNLVLFLSSALFLSSILASVYYFWDEAVVCAPAWPGARITHETGKLLAPFWAPPVYKDPVFQFLCRGVPQIELEINDQSLIVTTVSKPNQTVKDKKVVHGMRCTKIYPASMAYVTESHLVAVGSNLDPKEIPLPWDRNSHSRNSLPLEESKQEGWTDAVLKYFA